MAQVRIYDMEELLGKNSHATQREMLRWLGVQVRACVLGGVLRRETAALFEALRVAATYTRGADGRVLGEFQRADAAGAESLARQPMAGGEHV